MMYIWGIVRSGQESNFPTVLDLKTQLEQVVLNLFESPFS